MLTSSDFQLVSTRVCLVVINFISVILDPMFDLMDRSCMCIVFKNNSTLDYRNVDCDSLVELLKSKKHAKLFLVMLKEFEIRSLRFLDSVCKPRPLLDK